jgi:hypothetical protein
LSLRVRGQNWHGQFRQQPALIFSEGCGWYETFNMGTSYVDCGSQTTACTVSKTHFKDLCWGAPGLKSHFMTGDEGWFYLSSDYETIWFQEGELPIREKKVMRAEK